MPSCMTKPMLVHSGKPHLQVLKKREQVIFQLIVKRRLHGIYLVLESGKSCTRVIEIPATMDIALFPVLQYSRDGKKGGEH